MPEEFVRAERKIRRFRKYTIGYIHIDILFSPKIAKKRYYVFTAIDRVSKVAYLPGCREKNQRNGNEILENGFEILVERFNGKIKNKVFRRYILADRYDLEKKLTEYLNRYNFEVRLKQIGYMTPAVFLEKKFNKSIQPIVC